MRGQSCRMKKPLSSARPKLIDVDHLSSEVGGKEGNATPVYWP